MTNLLLTLGVSLVVNLAVLGALKMGLRNGRRDHRNGWDHHQPC